MIHRRCDDVAASLLGRTPAVAVRVAAEFMNGSTIRREKLRVMNLSPECMTVRLVRTQAQAAPEDWIFPASRLPEEWLDWKAGKEFDLEINEGELEWLQGKRDSDE